MRCGEAAGNVGASCVIWGDFSDKGANPAEVQAGAVSSREIQISFSFVRDY